MLTILAMAATAASLRQASLSRRFCTLYIEWSHHLGLDQPGFYYISVTEQVGYASAAAGAPAQRLVPA